MYIYICHYTYLSLHYFLLLKANATPPPAPQYVLSEFYAWSLVTYKYLP